MRPAGARGVTAENGSPPPEEVFRELERSLLAEHPEDERGRMLRSSGLRTAGRFYAFATGGDLVVKLPAARVAALIASGTGRPCEPRAGRPMREWVRLPLSDGQTGARLLDEARSFVAAGAAAAAARSDGPDAPRLGPTPDRSVS